jgi:hypothetical protein
LNWQEFKQLFEDCCLPHMKESEGQIEEGKLYALFCLFDGQSRGEVARRDFELTVERGKPAIPVIERLISRLRKGGERMERALRDELTEADAPGGCNGLLPIRVFQSVMQDYAIPVADSDFQDLLKFIERDRDLDSDYVDYPALLAAISPSQA